MAYYFRNFVFGLFYFSFWWFVLRPLFASRNQDFANEMTIYAFISVFTFTFVKQVFDRIFGFLIGDNALLISLFFVVVFGYFTYCLSIFLFPLALVMLAFDYLKVKKFNAPSLQTDKEG